MSANVMNKMKPINKPRPGPLSKSRRFSQNNKTITNEEIIEISEETTESQNQNSKNNKTNQQSEKIVVSADKFNNFENLNISETKTISDNSDISNDSENFSHHDNSNSSDLKLRISESETEETIEKSETTAKTFEVVLIKNENHETLDSTKISDNKLDKVGELHASTVRASHGITPSVVPSVSNKHASVSSAPASANRVFIIKNLAGKSVTIIPKTTPVVLNKETNIIKTAATEKTSVSKNILNKQKPVVINVNKNGNKTVLVKKILNPGVPKSESQCKNLIQQLPNTRFMKIADLNKSQKYFAPKTEKQLKIEKTESIPQRIIYTEVPKQTPQVIDLTEEKEEMQKNVISNNMPNFSKILHVLAESPIKNSGTKTVFEDTKIPIYVDCQTQTENLISVKDIAVQTEIYMPSPTPSIEDLPNITNLLEYVFNTPKYSSGLDEVKKSDLIDMSKNIVMKGKTMTQTVKGEEDLKKQLFVDLKDCATFDFLGNKPIHNAVLENNLPFLKRQIFALRLRKISLDIENNTGQTALQLAVTNNCNLDIIQSLLGNGASANILDNEGNNLVHLAVINSTHFVLESLITYLVNPIKEINRKNDEGLTPLMIASIDSKPEMVDVLLRNRADPNLRDEKSGRTALFHAVELNCNFVINLLLTYKADPKVRNYFGLTALDAAKDLDIPDSKILETEKETNVNNQASVIVNMNGNVNRSPDIRASPANKRNAPQRQKGADKNAKKSKLSFVSSLKKVEINDVKNTTHANTKRRKK